MMPLQRACDDENQARNKLSNGPRRAQSNGFSPEYSATCRHTSVVGDMLVSCLSAQGFSVNQGGTADSVVMYLHLFVLDRDDFLSRMFLFSKLF